MIIKNYFKKTKYLILYGCIFGLCIFLILVLVFAKIYINNNLISSIKNKIENRCLIIGKDEISNYEYLMIDLDYKYIQSVYEYIYPFYSTSNQMGISSLNVGVIELIPKIVIGNNLTESSTNSVIIPKYVKNNEQIIDTTYLLNTEINFSISNFSGLVDYSATVIGIYENEFPEEAGKVYFSSNDVKYFKNIIRDVRSFIVIDDEIHMNQVENNLKNKGFYYNLYDDTTYKELRSYKKFDNLITIYQICLMIIINIILLVFVYSILSDQKYDIALKKAVGYKNSNIFKIILSEIIKYFSILFWFISLIIFIITNILNIDVSFYILFFEVIIIYFVIIVQIVLICIIFLNKIKKIQIVNILKNN